jgi:hypothetical protein
MWIQALIITMINSPNMYNGSRIIEYAPIPLQNPIVGQQPMGTSYIGLPQVVGGGLYGNDFGVRPFRDSYRQGPAIIRESYRAAPIIRESYVAPLVTSYVSQPIIRQSVVQQQPTIVDEHRETTTTEEFIPAQPMMQQVCQSCVMNSQMQQAPWFGRTLLIRPVSAQLTHNTDFFLFRMDPFVEIVVGPNRYKTTVHHNGGKRPQWNETFSHPLFGGESEMSIIVWDQDRRKADLVGETRINLAQVLAHGSSSNWYELFWRGKTAGRILINMEIV